MIATLPQRRYQVAAVALVHALSVFVTIEGVAERFRLGRLVSPPMPVRQPPHVH
jgi:hypothetical protein